MEHKTVTTSDFDIPEENLSQKSDSLLGQLHIALGKEPCGSDWLSEYRKYLDRKTIRAEVDGWPSPEAFSQFNVRKFIQWELSLRNEVQNAG